MVLGRKQAGAIFLLFAPEGSSCRCKSLNAVSIQTELRLNLKLTEGYQTRLTDLAGKAKQDLFRFRQFIIYIERKSKVSSGISSQCPLLNMMTSKQKMTMQ